MPQYQSVITLTGQGKIADAIANGPAVNITELSAGDGNGAPVVPLETQNALVHEVWRGNVLSASRDPANPTHVIVQALIPAAAGPFTIRELALWTSDGQCFAVMNTPEIVKTTAAQGATQDITVSFRIVVDTAANITVNLDPAQLTPVSGLLRAPFIAIDGFVAQPPANPAAGALYVVSANPAGAFAALAHKFVQWNGTVWLNAVAYKDTIVGDGSTGLFWKRTAAGWEEMHFAIWIKQDTTFTVGAGQNYATLAEAFDAIRYKLIAPGVTVTLQLTAGQHQLPAAIKVPHLNGARLVVKGQALPGAFPWSNDIVASAANTLTALRALIPSELVTTGNNAFEVVGQASIRLENLLISGNGGGYGVVTGDSVNAAHTASPRGGGASVCFNVWVHGMTAGFSTRQGGDLSGDKIGASHNTGPGFLVNNMAYLLANRLHACRNGTDGIHVRENSYVELYGFELTNNGSDGIDAYHSASCYLVSDGVYQKITSNTAYGLRASGHVMAWIDDANWSGNAQSVFAQVFSNIRVQTYANLGTTSPALNTSGNFQSFISG